MPSSTKKWFRVSLRVARSDEPLAFQVGTPKRGMAWIVDAHSLYRPGIDAYSI